MWEHPFVACVGLIFWRGEGCFWYGCLLSLFSACAGCYPLDKQCTVHSPCTRPWEGWGNSWLPIGGSWVQAAGCPRGMRIVVSAASWDLCCWWAAHAARNGESQPVSALRTVCGDSGPCLWNPT